MKSKFQNGFTLIEVMLVLGIIAVLVSISLPFFTMYREKAADTAAEADCKNLLSAFMAQF